MVKDVDLLLQIIFTETFRNSLHFASQIFILIKDLLFLHNLNKVLLILLHKTSAIYFSLLAATSCAAS